MAPVISSLAIGILFGAGLSLSEMINPARVIGFLDVAGRWDATLLFVMAVLWRLRFRFIHGSFAARALFSLPRSACQRKK